jgi:membrane-associated protease RseP (regulator of RpoE activity)
MPHSPVRFFGPEVVVLTVWQAYYNPKNGKLPDAQPLVAFPDNVQYYDQRAGVQIKELRKGNSFGASLREGDIITAIDWNKTPSKELFRKVLWRKMAEGGPLITFTVLRADKTLEVPIPVKD